MPDADYRLGYEELERDSDKESQSDTENDTKQASPLRQLALAAAVPAAGPVVSVSAERMQQMSEHPRWSLRFVEQSLGTERLSKKELIQYLRDFASLDFLRKWKLLGTCRSLRRSRNCDDLINAFKVRVPSSLFITHKHKHKHSHSLTLTHTHYASF